MQINLEVLLARSKLASVPSLPDKYRKSLSCSPFGLDHAAPTEAPANIDLLIGAAAAQLIAAFGTCDNEESSLNRLRSMTEVTGPRDGGRKNETPPAAAVTKPLSPGGAHILLPAREGSEMGPERGTNPRLRTRYDGTSPLLSSRIKRKRVRCTRYAGDPSSVSSPS